MGPHCECAWRVALGCRVNQVVGPFWDELKSSAIHHEGHDWQLVHPLGGGHA